MKSAKQQLQIWGMHRMNARGVFYGRAGLYGLLLLFLALLLSGCGGSSDGGGVFAPDSISVGLLVEKEALPVNSAQAQAQPGSPHVSQIAIRVTERGSGVPVADSEVTVSFAGPPVGGLLSEADFFSGGGTPQPSVSLQAGGNGDARVYFVAGTIGGDARIRVRADRPTGGDQQGPVYTGAEATTTIRVVSTAGPVAALEFTGPFIEAIRTNRVQFGPAPGETIDFQNGTYSRVVSVTATDADGNPVPTNTPITFRLIDAPIQGYPEEGAGSFEITGFTGDPLEGGFAFDAVGGDFAADGARVGDRLVLDPNPDGLSFYHAGIRTIAQLPSNQPNSLLIRTDGQPFSVGADQGASVPYVIGRARVGSVQPLAFTDANGTASTLLTYPFSNLGRTAILAAHTEDFSVSRVFNPGTAVYLGSVEDGLNLTASTNILPSNVTNGVVDLCVRDGNQEPLPVQTIQFSAEDTLGASVDVNGLGSVGTLTTGNGGCATAIVNVQDQFPGSSEITLRFSVQALGESDEVEVTILAPDSGNLIGNPNCAARTLGLLYLTSTGAPISDALIFASGDFDWSTGSPNFDFTPPSAGGASAGLTNDSGAVSVRYTITLPPPEEDDRTYAYRATFETGNADSEYEFFCEFRVAGTGPPTDPPLVITTTALPEATAGQSYEALVQSSGGGSTGFPRTWTLVFNDGATGLSLQSSGQTSGLLRWPNPTEGSYSIFVEVSGGDQVAQRTLNLVVNPPAP